MIQFERLEQGIEIALAKTFVALGLNDLEKYEAIRRYPEVQTCRMMTGQVDYLLRVVATDLKSFGRFIEEKILRMPGVKDASSSIVLNHIKTGSNDLP